MARSVSAGTITIKKTELREMLREVVREVVRDELTKLATIPEENWEIEKGSVLWEDLRELRKEIREGRLQLYSRKEDLPE
jgi:DNA primase large subunit